MQSETVTIEIVREHPDYIAQKLVWRKYRDMYVGGELFKASADRYLVRRNKEAGDVYGERLHRVFYENYIGSIIDWFTATLFRREPVLNFCGGTDASREFFASFTDDCDLKGTTISDFLRKRFVEALVYGRSHILVDFPRWNGPAVNRAEEDAKGASRAYLIGYSPEELINWSYDQAGHYEWIVLRTENLRKDSVEQLHWRHETRWTYYDKENYQIYEKVDGERNTPVQLVATGRHGLANLGRVPLMDLTVSEGQWLMNRAGLLQLEHFNKSNALSWALTMGLFAMPVIYSEREMDQVLGESYYIQLGPNDKFGWTEPTGHVYQLASDNLTRLQEEIYRVCYLSQAGGELSGSGAKSGVSKERDFSITQEVLRAYGDAAKQTLKRVLWAVNLAREDGLTIDVTGLDEFDIGDFGQELGNAERLLALNAGSPTLTKQIYKRLALKYLCDVRQDMKDQIGKEIDDAHGG